MKRTEDVCAEYYVLGYDAGSIECHAGKYVNIQFAILGYIQLIVVIVAVVPRRCSQTTKLHSKRAQDA